ncbi:hypothetical protein [Streptomyces litchfieldiae]|uniref:Uncharacterized protein n=1 Tax=Streptomyces litchfieldiae TaxID=3075543 RepID=A0ABU2MKS2_9ACTN|nr:hypothetical protein [Streptomyces sp. DSM 44938]MDT0342076.1 hypothetical protein [Streptomyces sp. DSM 44938]
MIASVASRDPGPLAQVQTTHNTDIVIASLAGDDKPCVSHLQRWMTSGDTAILRVNSAGILAKLPGAEKAAEVTRVLAHDEEVRHLYMTAVTARTCGDDWTTAGSIARDPAAYPHRARYLAQRFATEALNPRDAGARWCSSVMLRELSPLIGWSPG